MKTKVIFYAACLMALSLFCGCAGSKTGPLFVSNEIVSLGWRFNALTDNIPGPETPSSRGLDSNSRPLFLCQKSKGQVLWVFLTRANFLRFFQGSSMVIFSVFDSNPRLLFLRILRSKV